MVREFLKRILRKPIGKLADRYASRPDKERVFKQLTALYTDIMSGAQKKGPVVALGTNRFIVFSDQHKGVKNGSDIFAFAEMNYVTALDYYNNKDFYYINLGDGEELWENTVAKIKRKNKKSFEKERLFAGRGTFLKVFGNHDLYWDNDPLSVLNLEKIYGQSLPVYEGVVIDLDRDGYKIFLTHGHQGDLQSDGNWFSKWFIANVWAPLQIYLELNLNTPSINEHLKTLHNLMMYEWSACQDKTLLITGHTHQAVFESLTHLERLYRQLNIARAANDAPAANELEQQIKTRIMEGDSAPDFTGYKPTYFNTGCCCFDDGDITGIEIDSECLRLIKWGYNDKGASVREVLEEITLERLIAALV